MNETLPLKATFTLAAAARELEVSRTTLYKWIAAGAIRTICTGPAPTHRSWGIRRIPREEILRLKAG